MIPVIVATLISVWTCPSCGVGVDAAFCGRCMIPEPPSGMAFIPACTVNHEGVDYEVPSFYIDSSAVSYFDILPWLNGAFSDGPGLARLVTGHYDEHFQFLRYTPFTGDEAGAGLTVPGPCSGLPACSITWSGASEYLASIGKRLPSAVELAAAAEAGLLTDIDVYNVMNTYADMMESSMGAMLGRLSIQAMFAGYSTASERVIWEWTGSAPGEPASSSTETLSPCTVIYRNGGPGVADNSSGYFNVAFRGVVSLPLAALK